MILIFKKLIKKNSYWQRKNLGLSFCELKENSTGKPSQLIIMVKYGYAWHRLDIGGVNVVSEPVNVFLDLILTVGRV